MAEGNIVNVSEGTFETEVLKSTAPVVVDFWAEWCGPCKMLMPVLNELSTEYAGKVKIAKVNVDQNGMLAGQYGITGIPALLFFKGGQVVSQVVGVRSKKDPNSFRLNSIIRSQELTVTKPYGLPLAFDVDLSGRLWSGYTDANYCRVTQNGERTTCRLPRAGGGKQPPGRSR